MKSGARGIFEKQKKIELYNYINNKMFPLYFAFILNSPCCKQRKSQTSLVCPKAGKQAGRQREIKQ